jgi:hypothetical protein
LPKIVGRASNGAVDDLLSSPFANSKEHWKESNA